MHVMNFLHLKLEFSFLTNICIKYAEDMEICKRFTRSLDKMHQDKVFFLNKIINNTLINILRASSNLLVGKQDNKRQEFKERPDSMSLS